MLEWLKAILGDAYTEDIDSQVGEETGNHLLVFDHTFQTLAQTSGFQA